MSTKSKFTIILVLTSLIGALVFGLLSYLDSRESLREAAFEELTAIRTARAQQVEEYFDSVFDEASVITENPTVSRALVEFRDAFEALETDESLSDVDYSEQLESFYERSLLPSLRRFIDRGEADAGTFMPRTEAGRYLQFRYMAENPGRYENFDDLTRSKGTTRYEDVHANFHESMRFIRDEFGYYDIFLIDAETGDVIYTVDKESDFATNIYDGPYRSSGLGDLVETIKDDPTRRAVHFEDLQFYLPSLGKPAIFVGSSIYEGNRVAGILAIQLTNSDLNSILTADGKWKDVGLKATGETYFVGPDNTLRSESRFFIEDRENYLKALEGTATGSDAIAKIGERDTSVLLQTVDTPATRAAYNGETDTRIIRDYRGVEVLSAFQPVDIDGVKYAFMAEIDTAEAFKPVSDLALRMMVTSAIVIPLTALFGIFISSVLMRPVGEIRDTARSFLSGDEDVHFQDQASDEWGQLGHELNRVLAETKSRTGEAIGAREEVTDMVSRLMPGAIAERYQKGETDVVSHAEEASAAVFLLMPDPKFNDLSHARIAAELYGRLDDALDDAAAKEGVDMINQAGMHYVAFCGLTAPMKNHAERLYRFCERARDTIAEFNEEHDTHIVAKVGFSSGPMLGALIGNYSTAYEIWGDTVLRSADLARAADTGDLFMTEHSHKAIGIKVSGKPLSATGLTGRDIEGYLLTGFFS